MAYKYKTEMAEAALSHTQLMNEKYKDEIEESIHNSEIFRDDSHFRDRVLNLKKTEKKSISHKIKANYNVQTLFSLLPAENEKVAVLNFASFKNPGGGFLKGSTTQEESLCHSSYLYNVLSAFYKEYYIPNQQNTFKCLYNNSAIYSAGIRFWDILPGSKITDETKNIKVDVITCAAPNYNAARKYYSVHSIDNYQALSSRIKFIKDICNIKGVNTLIAGAWGCGVFGQDPRQTSELFAQIFEKDEYNLERIIYAIPNTYSKNYLAFYKRIQLINSKAE